jgi:signal transduction histidine kinase
MALAILAVSAIFIATATLIWNLQTRELAHARVETENLTTMLLEQTEDAFNSADIVLQGVQERLQTPYGEKIALDSLPLHLLLGARIASLSHIRSLFIVDPSGAIINSSRTYPMQSGPSARDRDYYLAFADGKRNDLFIGNPVIGRADDTWTIHLARRIGKPDGQFRGIVVISIDLSRFEKLYDIAKLDFVRPVTLYLNDGTLVASLPHRQDVIGKFAPELKSVRLPIPASPGAGMQMLSRTQGKGQRETFSLAQAKGLPLLISVTNDEDEALESWRETATPIAIGAGLICAFIAIVAGLLIAELKREESLSQALREADNRHRLTIEATNKQLRSLSVALQDVREMERTHLSRELHDELGQQLTGLKLDLAWLYSRVKEGRPTEPARVDDMRKLLDNTIAAVRRISSDLRPPILDDLGFGEAVRWLKQETEKRSGLAIALDLPAESLVTESSIATALYRIVQEALTNILRHADAKKVVIRLTTQNDQLVLTVADDGRGLVEKEEKDGIGLASMQERVAALGGDFSIANLPEGGVSIEARIPSRPPDIGKLNT